MSKPAMTSSRRVRVSLAAILLLGCALPAARAETLADAVALAYQTNPNLLAQRQQLRALNENYVQARSNFGPRLSADAGGYDDVTHYGGRRFAADSYSDELVLTQPLFTGGRIAAAVRAAEADVRAGRERLRQGEADLLRQVVTVYISVRRDQQILTVAHASTAVLQQQLEETRAKFDVRENTRTDLAQAEARLASAQAQVFSAEAQLAASRAQYLNAVGQNPGDLAPEPDLPGVPTSVDAAYDAAERGNRTLLAAKYTELGSRARIASAKAEFLPSIDVRVQASHSPQALYVPSPYIDSVTAQATISQPLFTAGQNASGVRRATATNNADRLLIDANRRNVMQALAQQWSLLSASRNALVADQANVTASETAFFGMREEERFGLRSTIELLNAQQELTGAQISLLRDRANEYAARAGVLNIMGALTVELLAPGLKTYDVEADFDHVKNKGALPTEEVVKVLDSIATPALKTPLPARETVRPDQQLDLPPTPPPAADLPPLRPVTDLMAQTVEPPAAVSAPIATAPRR